MIECQHCCKLFTRRDNFLRHKNNAHDCKNSTTTNESNCKELPTPDSLNNDDKLADNSNSISEYVRTAREAIKTKLHKLKRDLSAEKAQRSMKRVKHWNNEKKDGPPKNQWEYDDDDRSNLNKDLSDEKNDLPDKINNNKINEDYDVSSEAYNSTNEEYNFDSDENESNEDYNDASDDDAESSKRIVYWNNPNKLVNRFKELVVLEQGGEIARIITELRKHGYDELTDAINNLPNDVLRMKNSIEQDKLKKDIAAVTRSIREKQRGLKVKNIENTAKLESLLSPITNPLKELVTEVENRGGFKLEPKQEDIYSTRTPKEELKWLNKRKALMSDDEFATPTQPSDSLESEASLEPSSNFIIRYLKLYTSSSKGLDTIYGIYFKDNKWKIGNSSLIFDGPNLIIKGTNYKGTPGLLELLFMKKPLESRYDEQDLANYREILDVTNAHKRNYDKDEQIKGSKSYKYKHIISKFVEHKGMGFLHLPKENIDYIRWEDPNDLVNRLRFLLESDPGEHHNEIVSIIEELREAQIIE